MRFVIIGSRGYPSTYGGFETFVRRLAPYLRDSGDEVTVYGRQTGLRTRTAVNDGIEVVETAGIDRKQLSTLVSGLTASVHARRRRSDAALVLNCANGPWLPILRSADVPTVVNVDGIEWERDKWGRFGKAAFRFGAHATARYADQIIVDAEEIGRIWAETFGVQSTFIPYGADVRANVGSTRVRAMGLEPSTYALAVARLVPENNVDLFLDALDLVPGSVPAVIVGSSNYDSPVQRRLDRAVAQRKGLHALGHVHDQNLLSELWANCAVYFHGHSVGGTNPALLQALGHGSPTLALDTAFNREVLRDDEHLVPADAMVLGERIARILAEPGTRKHLADRGQSIIEERYRWDDVCASYRTAMVEAAESRSRKAVP